MVLLEKLYLFTIYALDIQDRKPGSRPGGADAIKDMPQRRVSTAHQRTFFEEIGYCHTRMQYKHGNRKRRRHICVQRYGNLQHDKRHHQRQHRFGTLAYKYSANNSLDYKIAIYHPKLAATISTFTFNFTFKFAMSEDDIN